MLSFHYECDNLIFALFNHVLQTAANIQVHILVCMINIYEK